MTTRSVLTVGALFAAFLLAAAATANGSAATAVFIDGAGHQYLRRHQSTDSRPENIVMSSDEVAGVMLVLLGLAPPTSLTAESSVKLNEVLLPNPFHKPRAMFLLEVDSSNDAFVPTEKTTFQLGNILQTEISGSNPAAVQISDADDVVVVRSDVSLSPEIGFAHIERELNDLASWLGGSYLGNLVNMDGQLSLPLKDGKSLDLHVSKKADLEFVSNLLSLSRIVQRGVRIHEKLDGTVFSPSELLVGRFTGIKALEEEYGSSSIVEQGMEVFHTALSKMMNTLYTAYEGKIVGLVIYNNKVTQYPGSMIDVTALPRVSRFLQANSSIDNSTIEEVLLVRQTLAWITAIVLLVATLIGVCMLMYMPLTKDTLLYSNVKLD